MRGTERSKIAVRRRQHDNIGGILPEIAGDVTVVNVAAAVEFQMHAYFGPLLSRQRATDSVTVEALQADHHEMLGLLDVGAAK